MHAAVEQWVTVQVDRFGPFSTVVEFGGRDINGTVRGLFGECTYTAVDLVAGPGVDVVADCADWQPDTPAECVVCTEVLEHTARWREIVVNAAACLTDGGVFIATCAGPGRPAHGADGSARPHPGEHYENVHPGDLDAALADGFTTWGVDVAGSDLRCWAVK